MHKHKSNKSNVVKFPAKAIKPQLQQDWEQFISCDGCRGNVDKTMDELEENELTLKKHQFFKTKVSIYYISNY